MTGWERFEIACFLVGAIILALVFTLAACAWAVHCWLYVIDIPAGS